MKKKIITLFITWTSLSFFAQDITGQWNGVLNIQGIQLRLVFHIKKTADGYSSTMDSPDQKATGLPVTSTTFENQTLKLSVASPKIEYQGVLGKNNIITGTFKQNGIALPLNLSREEMMTEKPRRPQEPIAPYPYLSEEISFENQTAGIRLKGTLTLPKKTGVFPAVVLISGSGPQNRDEELLGHKPFLVLSDYLTKNGIAVLRFDDRGTASSGGNFETATSLDFSTDVAAAVKFLETRPEINKSKIGLIGHSEGGMIAPMVAVDSKSIAFIVLMAGPGIRGDQLLLTQQQLIGKASGMSDRDLQKQNKINKGAYDIVVRATDQEQLKLDLSSYLMQSLEGNPNSGKPEGMSDEEFVKIQTDQITSPWMHYFLKYDPAITLEKVKCPVLALNGGKDLQVAKENLDAIHKALVKGGYKKGQTIMHPQLNHLFQECTTGSPEEYAKIEQTISPMTLEDILKWVQQQTK